MRGGLTKHQTQGPCYDQLLADLEAQQKPSKNEQSPQNLRNRRLMIPPSPPQKQDANVTAPRNSLQEITDQLASIFAGEKESLEGDSGDEGDFPFHDDDKTEESVALSYNSEKVSVPQPPEDPDEDPDPGPEVNNQAPNTWIWDQFQEHVANHVGNFLPFSDEKVTAIKLMHTLKLKKAPLNAYSSLIEWHFWQSGKLSEYEKLGECPLYIVRETLLKWLNKCYNMEMKKPYTKLVKLPVSGQTMRLTLHDTAAVIQGLLTDPRLKDADYLFYDNDPLAPPPKSHTTLGDLNTGKAFQHTYKALKIDPSKGEQLMPLVLYIDGSAITHFHDMELIQVKVGLGILSRMTQNKSYAWGVLGYIEKVKESGGKGHEMWQKGQHMDLFDNLDPDVAEDNFNNIVEELPGVGADPKQDFHAQISVTLRGIVALQVTGFIWDLVWKGKLYKDMLWKIFVPFVKSDTQEADTLCAKCLFRGKGTKQICRYCHVPTDEADDHLHECVYKTQPEVQKLVAAGDLRGLQAICSRTS